ncbi:hypothetical protein B0H10DRAFT_1939826 [Mycena sp. CBHHK59/15]|nr:hypothetical protein B0H10DRAFT_1939826 [Mycena sp. CBHHK59/15]
MHYGIRTGIGRYELESTTRPLSVSSVRAANSLTGLIIPLITAPLLRTGLVYWIARFLTFPIQGKARTYIHWLVVTGRCLLLVTQAMARDSSHFFGAYFAWRRGTLPRRKPVLSLDPDILIVGGMTGFHSMPVHFSFIPSVVALSFSYNCGSHCEERYRLITGSPSSIDTSTPVKHLVYLHTGLVGGSTNIHISASRC